MKTLFAYISLFFRWLYYDYDWVASIERNIKWRINLFCAIVLMGCFVAALVRTGMGEAKVCVVLAVTTLSGAIVWLLVRTADTKSVVMWCIKNFSLWVSFTSFLFLIVAAVGQLIRK